MNSFPPIELPRRSSTSFFLSKSFIVSSFRYSRTASAALLVVDTGTSPRALLTMVVISSNVLRVAGVRGLYRRPSMLKSAAAVAPKALVPSSLFRLRCSRSRTSPPSVRLPRSTPNPLGFFACVGALSCAVLPPISRMLMRPASDSGSPVCSSGRREVKRRSAWRTRLDMAAYLNCARLLGFCAMVPVLSRTRAPCAF